MKLNIWLVIANTVEAKIYDVETRHQFKLIKELSHNASRFKTSELVSDRPGHYQSGLSGHGQFISPTDAHKDEHCQFAKEIAKFLDQERKNHQYESLIICMEPHFHGLLNSAMNGSVQSCVKKHIRKDYIPLPENKLNQTIAGIIDAPLS